MSAALNWTRARRASAPDLHAEQRRAVMRLGPAQLLARARALYRASRHAGRGNPFCRRCTDALAARRFTALCTRCLFLIGRNPTKARRRTR